MCSLRWLQRVIEGSLRAKMISRVNGQVEVPTGGQGGRRWWPTKVPTPGVRCVGGSVLPSVVDVGAGCAVWQPKGEAGPRLLEAPPFARGDDHDGVEQEAIEQRGRGTRNRQEAAPVLERPVARQGGPAPPVGHGDE